jgi:hypothetical protein
MPIVGIILGLLLAVWVSVFTMFNDTVLQQPLMTGNLMPTSVYGPAVLLAMLGCGLTWGRLRERQLVGRRDVVVLVVLGTAACAWPGTNFLRTFVGTTANPANLAKTQDHWREARVFDHVPPGLLVNDGRELEGVTDVLTTGAADPNDYTLDNVPWSAWWPVLRLWGGLALLFGLASVCLGLVVHPQWSRHERLPYPLVRFLEELTRPGEAGSRPGILKNKLFWLGLGGVAGIHLVNGLGPQGWDLIFLQVPLEYDLRPLQTLFPNTNVFGAEEFYQPHLFFSVIAFCFFIRGDVSFSVGISQWAWVALSAAFVARGATLGNNPLETEGGTLLRAGAYLGFTLMILYLGRRAYLQTAAAAVGLRRPAAEERAGVWGLRGLVVCLVAAVWMMSHYAQLDWRLGLMFALLSLVILLILARLSAETGLFYVEPNWVALVVIVSLLGFEGLGPAAFITVALFSTALIGVPREPLTGYVVNALALTERVGLKKRLGGTGLGIAGVAAGSLVLAVIATLTLVYTRGLAPREDWANIYHPSLPFNALARRVSELRATGGLEAVIADAAAGHFAAASPDGTAVLWLLLGAGLVIACAFARLRLSWWPIHPVLFFMLGSSASLRLAWSFLIGWAIRAAVVRLGGVRAFQAALPLAIGMIAGELLAALGWQAVGSAYYFLTGVTPRSYFILPN